jgi:hypothetical protein
MPIGKQKKASNPGKDWMERGSIGQSEVQFDWGQAERTRCRLNAFQVAPSPGIEIIAINTRPIRGGLEGRKEDGRRGETGSRMLEDWTRIAHDLDCQV